MKITYQHRAQARRYSLLAALLLSVVIVLTGVSPAASQVSLSLTETNMQPAAIHAMVQQAAKAWMEKDADGFAALFTLDGELIVPGYRWTGPTAIRQVTADFSAGAAEVNIKIQRTIVEGNQAAVEWQWEDVEQATGQRNRAEDVIMIDFAAGKIRRWREYIDTQSAAGMRPGG